MALTSTEHNTPVSSKTTTFRRQAPDPYNHLPGCYLAPPVRTIVVIPLQMPANQDKALHLLFRTISRGAGDPTDDLIARLKEIEDARTDLLADDEYAAFRSMVLRQVVKRVRVPLGWQITLAVCCLGSIAMIVYGVLKSGGAVVGGGAGLIVGAYLWYGLERDYAAKRALGRDERLRTIERLVSAQLVAENEAVDLRSKVLAAFPAEAG